MQQVQIHFKCFEQIAPRSSFVRDYGIKPFRLQRLETPLQKKLRGVFLGSVLSADILLLFYITDLIRYLWK